MSRSTKIFIAIVVVFVLLTGSFTGCGDKAAVQEVQSGKADESVNVAESSNGEVTTLKIMHWRVEDADVFKKLNEDFEKENPNIKIEMDMLPTKDYPNVLNVRLGNGDVDIVGVDPLGQLINKIPGILKSDSLLDLSGQEFLNNYNPSILGDNAKYNGKILAVPTSLNTVVVFYNKDLFKKMNIEIPKTYSAFIEACKKLKSSGTTPIAFGGKDGWPINVDMIGVEGAVVRSQNPDFYKKLAIGETKFTDPLFVDVLKKTKEISTYFEDKCMGVAYADAIALFAQQKAAMLLDGSWSAADIQKLNPAFNVGVFVFPGSDTADPSKFVPVKYGMSFAVSNKTDKHGAAFKYLAWFSSKEVYKTYITGIKQLPTQDGITFNDPLLTDIAALLGNNIEYCDQLYPAGSGIDPWQSLQKMVLDIVKPEDVAKEMQGAVDNIKK